MQQQQQPANQFAAMPPQNPPVTITTEQIQKYLDENKQLILAILDNQNLGKLAECAQYQAQLQKNLLFLAAIADAQPQSPAVRPQMMPHAPIQHGGHYMPQGPIFPPRAPFNPQQVQEQQQQQQYQLHHQPQLMPFQGQMVMRPGVMNGMHAMHAEASLGGSGDVPPGPSMAQFARGSKQDMDVSESGAADDGHKRSATEQTSKDAEPARLKRPEDGKTP